MSSILIQLTAQTLGLSTEGGRVKVYALVEKRERKDNDLPEPPPPNQPPHSPGVIFFFFV